MSEPDLGMMTSPCIRALALVVLGTFFFGLIWAARLLESKFSLSVRSFSRLLGLCRLVHLKLMDSNVQIQMQWKGRPDKMSMFNMY